MPRTKGRRLKGKARGNKYIAQGNTLGKSIRTQVMKKPRAMPRAMETIGLVQPYDQYNHAPKHYLFELAKVEFE